MLRALMQAHRFSQVRLAQQTGIAQSTLSAVLKETGSLTKEQVITLARFFHVSPAAETFPPALVLALDSREPRGSRNGKEAR